MNDPQDRDREWMKRALRLARKGQGLTSPNPPVGAVLVRNGRMIGEGYHHAAGQPHAEIEALNKAVDPRGSTLYVTLEPCSTRGRTGPCTSAIISAGITRIVVAVIDPNPKHAGRGIGLLRKAGIDVCINTFKLPAEELIAPFRKWIQTGTPLITLKLALSMDGRIADKDGSSKWISSSPSRALVQRMRRRADAIMVGGNTAAQDDPGLLPASGMQRSRIRRIVLDSKGRVSTTLKIFSDQHAAQTILATTSACPIKHRAAVRRKGALCWTMPSSNGMVSLRRLLCKLGAQGITHLLCEGGGHLAASLVKQGLVDEYCIFLAPLFLGSDARPCLAGAGWSLHGAPHLDIAESKRVGPDIFIRAYPRREQADVERAQSCSLDL